LEAQKMTAPQIALYGWNVSGHVHRVALLLEMLELPYRYIETTADFRAKNPLGQVPVLQDGDLTLADSNAILVYLARRYAPDSGWLPADSVGEARAQRWLSLAAGELRYGPAAARVIALFKRPVDPKPALAIANTLFALIEAHLASGTAFLAAKHPTIADLACYAYVARAPEGGASLEAFPALRAWLARIEALPRFKPMPWTAPNGKAAP
jgi:glutathione S-transferase